MQRFFAFFLRAVGTRQGIGSMTSQLLTGVGANSQAANTVEAAAI
jgi:hypothetical protein